MPQIASITINDGQATPVPHVFNPVMSVPPTYRRNGVSGQAVIANERLLMQSILAKTVNGVNRIQLELVVPVVETPAGGSATGYVAPPAIAHEMRVKVEFFFHQRSDRSGRRDLRILLANLLSDAQLTALVDDLEQPF